MPWVCLVSHSKPLSPCWAGHPYEDGKSKVDPSPLPIRAMYLPNLHPVSGPCLPVNGISGCTTRRYGKKAMDRGKNEILETYAVQTYPNTFHLSTAHYNFTFKLYLALRSPQAWEALHEKD